MTWTTHNEGVCLADTSDVSAGDAKLDAAHGRDQRPGSLAYSASALSASTNTGTIHHKGVLRSQPSKVS
jgi:hypothetical protein